MASYPYVLKPATIRDVHAVRRLELIVFPRDAYSYLNLSTLIMWPGGANFKALDGTGEVVGFVAGSPNYTSHIDWIVTLGVHPAHQNRGLGRRLLRMSEAAMSQPRIRLTVRVSNAVAIGLYQSEGYTRCYLESRYYNDGEDGIVMEKVRSELS